jgi:hypothetical protein
VTYGPSLLAEALLLGSLSLEIWMADFLPSGVFTVLRLSLDWVRRGRRASARHPSGFWSYVGIWSWPGIGGCKQHSMSANWG